LKVKAHFMNVGKRGVNMRKKISLLFCVLILFKSAEAKLFIASQNIPVRNSNVSNSFILGFINDGDTIDVTDINNTSGKIAYRVKYGYINTEHLKAVPQASQATNDAGSKSPSLSAILLLIASIAGLAFIIKKLFFAPENYPDKAVIQPKNPNQRSGPIPTIRPEPIRSAVSLVTYWYQCSNCSAVVKKNELPSRIGCSKGTSHKWVQLAEVGPDKYFCKHCHTTIQAATFPVSNGCPAGEFHDWSKI
jgi:hypothetical protein